HARVAGPRKLRAGDPVRVRARCTGGPCDVRISARARSRPTRPARWRLARSVVLREGRQRDVMLDPTFGTLAGARRERIRVVACSADGAIADRLTLHPRLRAVPPFAFARPVGARARRVEGGIRVPVG
ncbi:MAG TPA: hypothetical protein VFR97_05350, partial [Capillimicrobium sp.]|nr:hypothetical protein [Capillimicrobium sp.]